MMMGTIFGVKVNPVQSRLLQLAFFKAGYKWYGTQAEVQYLDKAYLYPWTDHTICHSDKFSNYNYRPEITFEEALEWALTGKECWEKPILVSVDTYEAQVFPGKSVNVGCVNLDNKQMDKLINAYTNPKQEVVRYAIKCNEAQFKTLIELANRFDWGTVPDYSTDRECFIFNSCHVLGECGFNYKVDINCDSGKYTQITFEDAIIKLVDGSMKTGTPKEQKLKISGKTYIIRPGKEIEVIDEITINDSDVQKLIAAYRKA